MKNKGATDEKIALRRKALQEVIVELHKASIPTTNEAIITKMVQRGYKTYWQQNLYRDMTWVNKNNTFVRDITESNYSAMCEAQFQELADIQAKVKEWTENPPTETRQVYNAEPDSNPKNAQGYKLVLDSVIHNTVSPMQILSMRKSVADTQLRLLNGDIVNTSIALLTEEFKSMSEEIEKNEELKLDIEEAKEQKRLKRKKKVTA